MNTHLFKRYLLPVIIFFTLGGILSSCGDDEDEVEYIVDVYPAILYIDIQNEQGENLLLPETVGSLYESDDIYMIYNETKYPMDWRLFGVLPLSRSYVPYFKGLYLGDEPQVGNIVLKKPHLQFGEFSGTANNNISADLIIGDYPPYHIEFTSRYKYLGHDKESIKYSVKLNDEKEEKSNSIMITLPQK